MAEDASLDEFTSGSETDTEMSTATTTYTWSEDGAPCKSCDEVVQRRWQQNGSLVCSACKEWDEE